MDSEGRLGEIKATLEGWLNDARERKPALLVLDGLDHLLGPENEVSPLYLFELLRRHRALELTRVAHAIFAPDHTG